MCLDPHGSDGDSTIAVRNYSLGKEWGCHCEGVSPWQSPNSDSRLLRRCTPRNDTALSIPFHKLGHAFGASWADRFERSSVRGFDGTGKMVGEVDLSARSGDTGAGIRHRIYENLILGVAALATV